MTEAVLPPGAVIDDEGIWNQVLRRPGGSPRPALLLDRDGVIVIEVNYLHKVEDVRLEEGAAALIAAANARDIPVGVVTNQAGIGYGHYGWADFAAVQERILGDLAAEGAFVDAVFACPHHTKGKPPYQHPNHPARKPNPGMLERAGRRLNLDLSRSWIVGDRAGDLEAGRRAGLAGGIHVLTGHGAQKGERDGALALNTRTFLALGAPTLAEARPLIPLLG